MSASIADDMDVNALKSAIAEMTNDIKELKQRKIDTDVKFTKPSTCDETMTDDSVDFYA